MILYQSLFTSAFLANNNTLYFFNAGGIYKAVFGNVATPEYSLVYEKSNPNLVAIITPPTEIFEDYNTAWTASAESLTYTDFSTGIKETLINSSTIDWMVYIGSNEYLVQDTDLLKCTTSGCTTFYTGNIFGSFSTGNNAVYIPGIHEVWKIDTTTTIARLDISGGTVTTESCPCCGIESDLKAFQMNDPNVIYLAGKYIYQYIVRYLDLTNLGNSICAQQYGTYNGQYYSKEYVYTYNALDATIQSDRWTISDVITISIPSAVQKPYPYLYER